MSEMVERIARAILAVDYPEDAGSDLEEMWWERRGDAYLAYARAALEAMREPTEQMAQAGLSPTYIWVDETAEPIWRRMIDEALK